MGFSIADTAQGILDALVAQLLQNDEEFAVPEWRYVLGASQVAFDTEQFTVTSSLVYPGSVGLQQPGRYVDDTTFVAQYEATIVRCLDAELPLSLEELVCQGRTALEDGDALLYAAIDAYDAGNLIPGCTDVQIGPLSWIGPRGAVVGTTLAIIPMLT